jgi:hypothetical protein
VAAGECFLAATRCTVLTRAPLHASEAVVVRLEPHDVFGNRLLELHAPVECTLELAEPASEEMLASELNRVYTPHTMARPAPSLHSLPRSQPCDVALHPELHAKLCMREARCYEFRVMWMRAERLAQYRASGRSFGRRRSFLKSCDARA